jgi:kynurenine formamidase
MGGSVHDERSGRALFEAHSNAKRWGELDERGTLNHLDAAAVLRGAGQVVDGEVVSIGKPLGASTPGFSHEMLWGDDRDRASQDEFTLRSHGYEITHVDALSHGFFEGVGYNGRRMEGVVHESGLSFGSIAQLAGGIVARGVFLDVPRALGREHLEAGHTITRADLETAEREAQVALTSGDVLCLRSGLDHRLAVEGAATDAVPREGLGVDAIGFLQDRELAAVALDCIERLPSDHPELPMPLHQIGLAAMGLVMIDACDMEVLAAACRRHSRHTFLFMAAPLAIDRATGSPVNPLVVF